MSLSVLYLFVSCSCLVFKIHPDITMVDLALKIKCLFSKYLCCVVGEKRNLRLGRGRGGILGTTNIAC